MDNSDITTGNKYEPINPPETEVKMAVYKFGHESIMKNQLTEKAKEVKETIHLVG